MNMKKAHSNYLPYIIILIFIVISGCGQKSKILQIKGSDTMVNMTQALVEEFAKVSPGTYIAITGGGSGTGVAGLISGTADIAQCSRDITEHEMELAMQRNIHPIATHPATDGIAVVVSPKNPVARLTMDQLAGIFSGRITNWKELGGPDRRIVALSRDRNSGTHLFFLEHVVKKGKKKSKVEFAKNVLMMPSTQAIVEEISANPEAIGYIGLGYANERTRLVAVAKDSSSAYIVPTISTASSGIYPISRALLFYTNGEPKGDVKEFIDFVLGKKGQEIVVGSGFVPAN